MRPTDLAAAVVVALAVGLVLLTDVVPRSEPESAPVARSVPVESSTLVCPPAPDAETAAAAAVAPRVPNPSDLPTTPVRIATDRGSLARLDDRNSAWSGSGPQIARGVRVSADGALAGGLSAASAASFDSGNRRGLEAASCNPPGSHWWFVGTASTPERSSVLNLTNPTTGVAVADLSFYGPNGPLESAAEQGLAIAPGETTALRLAELVPGAESVSVEVTARQGQVAASLDETTSDLLDPAGVEAVPAAAEPRRSVVMTGVPGGPGERTLSVVNPGASTAVVGVEVLGARGAFTPSALEDVTVPAGSTVETEVPRGVVDAQPAGIRLTADQPVTASLRTGSGSPLQDQSFAVSAEEVEGTTVAPLLPRLDGDLVLSGTGRTALTVDVVTSAADGRSLGRRTLDIRGGQTRTVDVGGGPAAFVTVRRSGSGPLVASMTWSRADASGELHSVYPLAPLRVRIDQPPVEYAPAP
jgi:Family of unknown function (DUF5719)